MGHSSQFQIEPFEFDYEFEEEWETGSTNRSSASYIKWVQQSLNQIMGLRLAVDGISGTQTRSAIRSFQQQRGLTVDGIVGPQTEAAIKAALTGGTAPLNLNHNLLVEAAIRRAHRSGRTLCRWLRLNSRAGTLGRKMKLIQVCGPCWKAIGARRRPAYPPRPTGGRMSRGVPRLFRG